MAVDIGEMLDRLLTEGARHSDDTHDYELTMVPLGDVTLPTGRVVACDPLVDTGETPPFTVTVPPGRYPLRAWIAIEYLPARALHQSDRPPAGTPHPSDRPPALAPHPGSRPPTQAPHPSSRPPARAPHPGSHSPAPLLRNRLETDRHTTALQLVIRDEPATTWEPARPPNPPFLDEDGFPAYPVDTGTATLADERALQSLSTWDYAAVEEAFVPTQPPESPPALTAVTDPPTAANVVAVTPGCGDGAYATFIGRTATGEVSCFVTDFRVI